jgi:4-diphosphocytidyl-2-C-methyl-D-erythritol kinase
MTSAAEFAALAAGPAAFLRPYNKSAMPTTIRSHAKINLGLGIGAPRPDGFHALVTVYQTLEMHDLVTVSAQPATETRIQLTSNDSRVPTDGRNTAWKMAEHALVALGITADVNISIEKRLPVQGGLGAGSANAVAALIGLEQELKQLKKPALIDRGQRSAAWHARRLEIAAQVGSDVPLFLVGGAVLGLDRGQDVYPLPDFEPVWCVIAVPVTGVPTPQAFRDWDALCAAEGLTAATSTAKLKELSRAYASAFAGAIPETGAIREKVEQAGSSGVLPQFVTGREDLAGPVESALVRTGITSWIQNDFERVVFRQHPSLAEIKRILAASDRPEAALYASLSGSGSALFGLYLTRSDAEAAMNRLRRHTDVRSTLTRTLPRAPYWNDMLRPT